MPFIKSCSGYVLECKFAYSVSQLIVTSSPNPASMIEDLMAEQRSDVVFNPFEVSRTTLLKLNTAVSMVTSFIASVKKSFVILIVLSEGNAEGVADNA